MNKMMKRVVISVAMVIVVTMMASTHATTAHAGLCEWQYQWVCNPWGCFWKYVWVCW